MHSARRWIACLLLGLTGTAAWAGSYTQYLQDLAWRESRHRLSERAGSHIGLFQMGTAALIDAGYMNASGQWTGKNGATSAAAFLSSAAIQTQAVHDYNQVQWAWIERNHLDSYIGQTINGVEITASGLLAAAHLVGRAGLTEELSLRSEDFGQRHFIVAAPDGVLIDVITPIEPSASYAAQFLAGAAGT